MPSLRSRGTPPGICSSRRASVPAAIADRCQERSRKWASARRVSGHEGGLEGFSPPVDGPLNGHVLITEAEPALAPRLVLDLAEYGEARSRICAGRRVTVGVAALLTEGQLFADRAA